MGRFRESRPSPAMVVAIAASVFAVTGTSVAGIATISALSKKEKKQTKAIAGREIRKAAPGLSVASAKTAGSADNAANATNATNAANADKLDGRDSSDFTAASRVQSSGRVVLNDPIPEDGTLALADVLVAGPFKIRVFCGRDVVGSEDYAQVLVFAPSGSSFSGQTTAGDVQMHSSSAENLFLFQGSGNVIHGGQVTAVAPSGEVVSISGSAEINANPAGDCVFGLTVIGP